MVGCTRNRGVICRDGTSRIEYGIGRTALLFAEDEMWLSGKQMIDFWTFFCNCLHLLPAALLHSVVGIVLMFGQGTTNTNSRVPNFTIGYRFPLPPMIPMPLMKKTTTAVEATLIPKLNQAVVLIPTLSASSQGAVS
jgi:hypothetical protein